MIITRYLSRQILSTTLAITLILLVVVVLGRMLNYLADASQGELDPNVLMLVLSYRLPDFLQLILPLAMLLGILLALGRLYADSEMTVLAATGFSPLKLLGITSLAASVVTAAVALLSLQLAPQGSRKVSELLDVQQNLSEFDLLVPGIFQNTANGDRTTYAESLVDGEMQTVFLHDGVNNRVIMAESAVPIKGEDGRRFVLFRDGTLATGMNSGLEYEVTRFDELGLGLAPRNLGIRPDIEEKTMTNAELSTAGGPAQVAELQWRWSLVLLVPLLALLAVPLSRVSPRQGRFAKLVPAILLYMLYLGLLLMSRDWLAEAKLPVMPGLWWVHIVFAILGFLLFTGRWPARLSARG
ncbi:MAG: LPS export ABC transporter permease LptF [Pseudomonadota bacterium]